MASLLIVHRLLTQNQLIFGVYIVDNLFCLVFFFVFGDCFLSHSALSVHFSLTLTSYRSVYLLWLPILFICFSVDVNVSASLCFFFFLSILSYNTFQSYFLFPPLPPVPPPNLLSLLDPLLLCFISKESRPPKDIN